LRAWTFPCRLATRLASIAIRHLSRRCDCDFIFYSQINYKHLTVLRSRADLPPVVIYDSLSFLSSSSLPLPWATEGSWKVVECKEQFACCFLSPALSHLKLRSSSAITSDGHGTRLGPRFYKKQKIPSRAHHIHANSFVIGTAGINTHTEQGTVCALISFAPYAPHFHPLVMPGQIKHRDSRLVVELVPFEQGFRLPWDAVVVTYAHASV
jgi:hypothetical protein